MPGYASGDTGDHPVLAGPVEAGWLDRGADR
jgi:hypothetical protein